MMFCQVVVLIYCSLVDVFLIKISLCFLKMNPFFSFCCGITQTKKHTKKKGDKFMCMFVCIVCMDVRTHWCDHHPVELYNVSGSLMVPRVPFRNQYPLSPR